MSNKESLKNSMEKILNLIPEHIVEEKTNDIVEYFGPLMYEDNSNENNDSISFNSNQDGWNFEIHISYNRDSNVFEVKRNNNWWNKEYNLNLIQKEYAEYQSGILLRFKGNIETIKDMKSLRRSSNSIVLKNTREYSKEEQKLLKGLIADDNQLAIIAIESSKGSGLFSGISEEYDNNRLINREKCQFGIDDNGKFYFSNEFSSLTLSIKDNSADIEFKGQLKNISKDNLKVIKRRIRVAKKHGIDVSKAKEKLNLFTPTGKVKLVTSAFPGSDGEIGDQGSEKLTDKQDKPKGSVADREI